jgi:hypothetical protein
MLVLACSVWLAYAADRWLEGWRLASPAVRTARHRFYQRYRWPVLAVWCVVLLVDVAVALAWLPQTMVERGVILVGPVLAYLLSHQLVHRHHRWRVPKEIVVALLLTAGLAVMTARPATATLAASLAAFAFVCFLNCVLISRWERDVDRAHGQTSLALQSDRGAVAIAALPWLAAAAGAALFLASGARVHAAVGCATASAVLLGIVDRAESRVGWAIARVLADAALLTPLSVLLWR